MFISLEIQKVKKVNMKQIEYIGTELEIFNFSEFSRNHKNSKCFFIEKIHKYLAK